MKTHRTHPPYEGYHSRIDWYSPELATLVAARVLPDGRVLDMGCGHGTESLFLAEMGWKVLGIDLDEDGKALRLARERKSRMAARTQANLRFKRADLLRFRERTPGTFGTVIDRLLISNLRGKDILRALRSVAYALRKDGVFILRIGINNHPAPFVDELSEYFPEESCEFLRRYFDFGPDNSMVVGYQGLMTPYQESGFLVTSSQAMGIIILHRNGERLAEKRRTH